MSPLGANVNAEEIKLQVEETIKKTSDHVLGEWTAEEREKMDERLKLFSDAILSYISVGMDRTMNAFNKK